MDIKEFNKQLDGYKSQLESALRSVNELRLMINSSEAELLVVIKEEMKKRGINAIKIDLYGEIGGGVDICGWSFIYPYKNEDCQEVVSTVYLDDHDNLQFAFDFDNAGFTKTLIAPDCENQISPTIIFSIGPIDFETADPCNYYRDYCSCNDIIPDDCAPSQNDVIHLAAVFGKCMEIYDKNLNDYDKATMSSDIRDNSRKIIKFSQLEEDYFGSVRVFLPPVDCGRIDVLDMSDFDFEKHENIKLLFTCKKRINDKFLEEYGLDPDVKYAGEVTYIYERHAIIIGGLGSIKNIIFPNDRHFRIYDMKYMFKGLNIREIDLSGFDTSCCKNMSGAFSGCKHLKSIDISKLDTSNCFRADGMFAECTQLENIKFGSKYLWNSIDDMFRGCTNLKKISCSSIDMPDLDRAVRMFQDCENLETVDFSNAFIESCVFIYAFKDCKNLKSVDFSETKLPPHGAYLACAFEGCGTLETIDFSSCEFDDKTLLSFNGLHSLREIIMKGCNDFSIRYVKNKILEAKDAGDGSEFNVEVVY